MTTFKTVVRRKRADGFYPVYIRVVHRTKMGYISTGKIVTDKQILKSGDIKDPVTRVRDKDCVKNRVKRAKIVRFTLC